ncbi:MAG TPA: hypothetical protein VMT17_10785 [Anaeromyxobacteraceae bacterium]|nr:hypothetical protein [Anaeromyxobacteraceae bacterium]
MLTSTVPFLLAALLGAAPPAADGQLRLAVDTYLGSIDTPISAARWKALGPRAPAVLSAIARDEGDLPGRRATAMAALGLVGGPEALAAARELSVAGAPFAVRVEAVNALSRLVSPSELRAALAPVMKGAAEARVRAVAAEALARHAPEETCGAVQAQAEAEAPADRPRYHRALAACARR